MSYRRPSFVHTPFKKRISPSEEEVLDNREAAAIRSSASAGGSVQFDTNYLKAIAREQTLKDPTFQAKRRVRPVMSQITFNGIYG